MGTRRSAELRGVGLGVGGSRLSSSIGAGEYRSAALLRCLPVRSLLLRHVSRVVVGAAARNAESTA